jgi:O-methyltransferase
MFYGIAKNKIVAFKTAIDTISMVYGGSMLASDMLITVSRNFSFKNDQHFKDSFYSTARDQQEESLIWRLHVLSWAAKHALTVAGDFVECGVLRGFSSAVLCKYLDFGSVPKTFYLYDTFSGLPVETSTPKERQAWNEPYVDVIPEELVAQVRAEFAAYPNVRVVQGIIPTSFEEARPESIAFLHVDLNSTQAEIQTLEHLFDRVSPGGLIVLDDFGWLANREQAIAELDFMRRRGHMILELPTGQGLIIKH